jgi:cell division protein FtsA
MRRSLTASIDIGTYEVRVVIAEHGEDSFFKVLGLGKAESKGLRHGYIIQGPDVTKSVFEAVKQAEKMSGLRLKRAFISIGGVGLSGIMSNGSTIISRADQKITESDIEQAILASEESIPPSVLQNRKVIYSIPNQWKIDGKQVFGRVEGLKAIKLEVKTLFITCIETHLDDLVEAVEEAGVEVIDVVASPIAASFITLTKSQKIAGCVLANIGAETVSIVVFENNIPISLEVFPIGGSDITNDIALGLKVSLEEAESIKLGGITATNYSKKKLEEIISARLSDIFDLIEAHLKKIGKSGMLPAGIIVTGGTSSLDMIEDLARTYLRLPSRIAPLSIGEGKLQLKDSSWSVAYGLCVIGSLPEEEERMGLKNRSKNILLRLWKILKQFLP